MAYLNDEVHKNYGCFMFLSWSMFGKHIGKQAFSTCQMTDPSGYSWLAEGSWFEGFKKTCKSEYLLYLELPELFWHEKQSSNNLVVVFILLDRLQAYVYACICIFSVS